ncbi:Pyoverdine/dityrosine biosynthesis protein-domain-containing protein [Xylaria bambusicola]|uniref:Pyoverdine/dityrosine biosynthesis protein-domain-containing protein n=1 Tax=Xylaria bambusicola TaxID=326684 RepID=UPI0020086D73|nr:Pyoverdine/dityrosine biosynthesis protein-domain-containing protein [Xylaria bambusicola]KAI0522111.1 Pyoverdine/dityrosine biosynthesis protein-domain-containing protein [Xylaria bambusicola]
MAPSNLNYGSSPFHQSLGLFCRSPDGRLLNVEGKNAEAITSQWPTIFEQLRINNTTFETLPSGLLVETTSFDIASHLLGHSFDDSHTRIRVREIYRETYKCYVGYIANQSQDSYDEAFLGWIETLFILKTTLQPPLSQELPALTHSDSLSTVERIWQWIKTLFLPSTSTKMQLDEISKSSLHLHGELVTEKITVLFEQMLRNTSANDEWNSSGREYFTRRIRDFVNRNERCQMVLPAFPCKSPNDQKVGGSKPDMAERIALETLWAFTKRLEEIYPPGATVWIIHDGHLLSSCIGVDDDAISEYESNLQELYRSMFNTPADRQAVRFCPLTDLFDDSDSTQTFSPSWVADPELVQDPIQTKLSDTAEIARKLVMASCGISRAHLRKLILAQDPDILRSYRGLSRFMLQDLEGPMFAGQSTSRKKKTAAAVASEMMVRNQAYSNLLELLYPNYVRLSIHAHNNRGPKFGIRLFPRDKVRAIDDVDGRHEPVPLYDFQIPTPWHNSIVKVEGDGLAYLTKASVARQAVASGKYTGGWVDNEDKGGYFLLQELVMGIKIEQTVQ